VPPYGQQRPRPTHVGKLITAIILLVAGPFLGLLIAGIGSAIVLASIATSGDVITNGQQVTLSSNDERTLYVPEDAIASACTVTAPDGKEIPTSHSTGSHISNNYGSYDSVLSFKVTKAGDYRVSCEGLSDTDPVLVGPGLTFHLFHLFVWPLAAGLCSGAVCWIIAVILLVRRHRALAAQTQVG